MTNGDPFTNDILPSESELANRLGIARNILANQRSTLLTPDVDFGKVHGRGIVYTSSGLEKMRAALQPMLDARATAVPQKNEGPPPDPPDPPPVVSASVTLIVARPSANGGLSCLCTVEGIEPPCRAFVRVPAARQKASTLSRGMRLTGCTPSFPGNPELFDYHGPVPARPGLPLPPFPEKKEVRP